MCHKTIKLKAEQDMALDQARLVKPAKKLMKLIRKLDRDPAPEQVHALRTSVLRFETSFKALVLDQEGLHKSIVKPLNRLRKRAGKVRDMDVLMALATTVHPKGEDKCRIQLLEHLGSRRQRYAKRLQIVVKKLRPKTRKALKQTPGLIIRLLRQNSIDSDGAVAANAAAAAVSLAFRLAVPPRLTRNNLHPYRLKVKELQNILRLAESGSQARFVTDLEKVKDAIGAWHDLEELANIASEVLNHGRGCQLVAEIKRMAEAKYQHALSAAVTLRKTYFKISRPHDKRVVHSVIPRPQVWEATARLAGC